MQEEECLGIHSDEDVVFKVCDAAANHLGTLLVVLSGWSLALDVVCLQIHPKTRKLKDLLQCLIVNSFVLRSVRCSSTSKNRESLDMIELRALECVTEPLGQRLELRRVHVVAGDLADMCHAHMLWRHLSFSHPQAEHQVLDNVGRPGSIH